MSHRTYSTIDVKIPTRAALNKKCRTFRLDQNIVKDFYNLLHGRGKYFTEQDHRNNVVTLLEKSASTNYQNYPTETIKKQLAYDEAAKAFVYECIKHGWVSSPTLEADLLRMNEAAQAGWESWSSSINIPLASDHNNHSTIPDFTNGLPPSDICNRSEATDFLREVCNEDYIDDIRLFSPSIQESLIAIRDLSQTVKASLAYNKGTSKRNTNEKTDFAVQCSNSSLQDAKFLARSEYAYDTNTRLARLASNQAQILKPQKKTRKKFARFLLLDCSGSMQSYGRVEKAAAVLLDSIESVVKHGDILHLSFFGDDFIYKGAVTKENAHDILLSVCNRYNYYTDNECSNPLQEAWKILEADDTLQKLEIIILSDGHIDGFEALSSDCDVVVHAIDLSGSSRTQPPIKRTVEEHNGTITIL